MDAGRDVAALVRRYFDAYVSKRREALEALLAEDFTFRCPLGNAIDRAEYLRECWPGSAKIARFDIGSLLVDGDLAAVRYVATLTSGAEFRSAEYFRVRNGRIVEVEVYFGNHPDHLFSIFEAAA